MVLRAVLPLQQSLLIAVVLASVIFSRYCSAEMIRLSRDYDCIKEGTEWNGFQQKGPDMYGCGGGGALFWTFCQTYKDARLLVKHGASAHNLEKCVASSGLPGWGWALIVTAILLLVAFLLAITCFLVLKRRKNQLRQPPRSYWSNPSAGRGGGGQSLWARTTGNISRLLIIRGRGRKAAAPAAVAGGRGGRGGGIEALSKKRSDWFGGSTARSGYAAEHGIETPQSTQESMSNGKNKRASRGSSKPTSHGSSKPTSHGSSKPTSHGSSKPTSHGSSKPTSQGSAPGSSKPTSHGTAPTSHGSSKPTSQGSTPGSSKPTSHGPAPTSHGSEPGASKPTSHGSFKPTSQGSAPTTTPSGGFKGMMAHLMGAKTGTSGARVSGPTAGTSGGSKPTMALVSGPTAGTSGGSKAAARGSAGPKAGTSGKNPPMSGRMGNFNVVQSSYFG
ncbi:hypothetical protein niasHT_023378 [Heterodera trifolii]|uniref:Uncharacterized protein n=1 Tax=Heterodera trifolii TaxID=157864 RepID=A0ABD2K3X4_9BILA